MNLLKKFVRNDPADIEEEDYDDIYLNTDDMGMDIPAEDPASQISALSSPARKDPEIHPATPDKVSLKLLQPKSHTEATRIADKLKEGCIVLLDIGGLTGDKFSVPLLGKVYDQMLARHKAGLEVSLGALADLTAEEMSHVAGVSQRQQGLVDEEAFRDYVRTIIGIAEKKSIENDDDLMKFRNKLKESKGTNQ